MEGHQPNKSSFYGQILTFKPHFNHEQESLPGLNPGMPWPAATYVQNPGPHSFQRFLQHLVMACACHSTVHAQYVLRVTLYNEGQNATTRQAFQCLHLVQVRALQGRADRCCCLATKRATSIFSISAKGLLEMQLKCSLHQPTQGTLLHVLTHLSPFFALRNRHTKQKLRTK